MKILLGKRFVFATIAVIAVSAVTSYLKFDGETYWKLIGTICAVFTASQSWTDTKKLKVNDNQKGG